MTCTYDFDKTAFSALNEKVQLKSHVNSHDVFAKGRERQKKKPYVIAHETKIKMQARGSLQNIIYGINVFFWLGCTVCNIISIFCFLCKFYF